MSSPAFTLIATRGEVAVMVHRPLRPIEADALSLEVSRFALHARRSFGDYLAPSPKPSSNADEAPS